ncbi:class I SAM-dependent methyltransferase [Tabrizicola oligotrophica]|uniref:Class I SAM-dependent methyltransferase n=1 Tax=Tabrizicola oligotrophica TaxID=2710650 RepID=A0A6M0QW51_9RHOB|nr:class I SAM-dependent methyltransferase [Tabrizicola oligotrophica]NEY90903.1 class I SAM-dependent methyltransferase [Tabrizicola oligotrophica]
MRSARLEMALESGAFVVPPEGDVVVLAPQAGDDLSALPKLRVVVLTGFKPDYDHFQRLGYRMDTARATAAVLCLPRAKAEALALIAQAFSLLPAGAPVLVDGQKTDGPEAVLKLACAAGIAHGEVISKAHGKAFVLRAGPAPAGWTAAPRRVAGGFVTRPGVFSADGPDRGSELLAAVLPDKIKGHVADLGAGWGYLARAILARQGVTSLDLVEADREALDCARENITDPRAQFHWADATGFKPARPWDAVVMNPPFHTSRAADPELGAAFIRAAHRGLLPTGTLWLVANRHLPYDRILTPLFRSVEDIGGDAAFRLIRAANPIRARL